MGPAQPNRASVVRRLRIEGQGPVVEEIISEWYCVGGVASSLCYPRVDWGLMPIITIGRMDLTGGLREVQTELWEFLEGFRSWYSIYIS